MTIETGVYLIDRNGARLHYALDVKSNYAGVCVFEKADEGTTSGPNGSAPWAEIEPLLSAPMENVNREGIVDASGNGLFIPDLPGTEHGGVYRGRSYVFLDGMVGHDEFVDYSIIDICTNISGFPLPWRNRFAQSAKEKIDFSWRFRAINGVSNALVIFMPFATDDLGQTRIELLCDGDPILLNGTTINGRIADADIPNDGQWFKRWFFTAIADAANITVPAGGSIDIPFHLIWNDGGAACERATRFKVESDAGYLPRARVLTDASGRGSVRVQALGLEAGEQIKIKLNAEHYTAVGVINVEVV
jgi:hypothetical protein